MIKHNVVILIFLLLSILSIGLCTNAEREMIEETSLDQTLQVVIFQIIMAIVGGLSYWAMNHRKEMSLSMFDKRKREAAVLAI